MSAETDFLNDALGQCGQERISSIDDPNVRANWCKTFYVKLRRSALRSHHWNFNAARLELAQDATAPAFEFAFAYTLPDNFLKIREYNGVEISVSAVEPWLWTKLSGRYVIEGRKLLSNESSVKVVYSIDIDNPLLWDDLFYQMLATWLASKLAMAIGRDAAKSQSLLSQAINIGLPLAAAVDGQEGTVIPYQVDDLLWGR